MTVEQSQMLIVGEGRDARRIAYAHHPAPAGGASVLWLSGFMSDMASTKATALADYARSHRLGCTRFDYSGHGASEAEFTDGTIGRWLDEAMAIFTRVTRGRQIVVGSSMGGHIALILLRRLMREAPCEAKRVKGLILIAPAWDMTEELMWKKFSTDVRTEILETGAHQRPSAYDAPYTITRKLIEDGRLHLLAREKFAVGCPTVILQGARDVDVPVAHARELMTFLVGDDISFIEIPDGEHRLSRAGDLEKLFAAVERIAAA